MTTAKPLSIPTLAALCFALPSLHAGQARADVGVAPAPVHNPENISQLGGHLVEVGDHNKYDRSYKRFNIGGNPLSTAILGSLELQGSYAINPMIALRGDVTLRNADTQYGANTTQVVGSVGIYFKKMYQGLFLEPGIMHRQVSSDYEQRTIVGLQTLVGYQFMWDSGLNVSAAIGGGRNILAKSDEDGYLIEDPIFANGYLRFGYAF